MSIAASLRWSGTSFPRTLRYVFPGVEDLELGCGEITELAFVLFPEKLLAHDFTDATIRPNGPSPANTFGKQGAQKIRKAHVISAMVHSVKSVTL